MQRSPWTRKWLSILVVFSLLLSYAPAALASHRQIDLSQIANNTGTALAHKQNAITLVTAMPLTDPDSSPIGKDFRKEEILAQLLASVDGTFRGGNAIKAVQVFDHDVEAIKRLTQLLAGPNVADEAKNLGRQAIQQVLTSDRLLAKTAVDSIVAFGDPKTRKTEIDIKRAQQELDKGDSKAVKGQAADAVRDYRKAWEYAAETITRLLNENDGDHDGVLDDLEQKLGLNPRAADSDDDGLSDGCEIYNVGLAGADPGKADTDGNGIPDGEEDLDGDGLTNARECQLGTNPLRADTDGDGLSDAEELPLGTDPHRKDTDDDLLEDASEIRIGTDPLNADTNGNGILDGLETYTTQVEELNHRVTVEITGTGDLARQVMVRDVSDQRLFHELPGQISHVIDLSSGRPFENARIRFQIDPAMVPNGDTSQLGVFHFDPDSRTMRTVQRQGYDPLTGEVWAETSHFSIYVVFHIPTWQTAFTVPGSPGDPGETGPRPVDVVFILDSSGSMMWNDREGYRLVAAKRFVDALITGDRAAVVDFDDHAFLLQGLTENMFAVKAAIDRIDSNGGTNIAQGVRLANNELIASSTPERIKLEILLTDGEGYYDHSLTQQATDQGIVIFAIGLGSDVDEALLQGIAHATGGQYFHVENAADLPDVIARIPKDPTLIDSDGDGLTDEMELNGIVSCTGARYFTDPSNSDSDGDAIPDGVEAAEFLSTAYGQCYQVISAPDAADTDGDGISDAEEAEIGTNPYSTDSDGDSLDDEAELVFGSEPTDPNPDQDPYNDFQEKANGTDPFEYDRTRYENGRDITLGFLLGDAGQNLINWGLLDEAKVNNLWYLGGWVASGFAVVGDIRDAIGSLLRFDLSDTFWNLAAIIPVAGDASKVGRIVIKFVGWFGEMARPAVRWATRQFMDRVPEISLWVGNHFWGDYYRYLTARGWTSAELLGLAARGNDLRELANLAYFSATQVADLFDIDARVRQNWGLDPAQASTRTELQRLAEARSTEATVKHLERQGYEVLYVSRTQGHTGPDLVAVLRNSDGSAGDIVVAEAKGSYKGMEVGRRLQVTSSGPNNGYFQLSHDWLRTNSARYMGVVSSQSPEAAGLLDEVILGRDYRALLVAGGPAGKVYLGKWMGTFVKAVSGHTGMKRIDVVKLEW